MRRLAYLGILFLMAATGFAAGDPWIRVRSANFDLYTDAGEGSARTIIRNFERVHSFFVRAGFGGSGAAPVCLLVFRSDKEFAPYRPNEVAAAYYQPGALRDYIVSTASGLADHPETAVHEYTHLMVRQSKREIPVWLNEGLAELYSNMQPQGKKVLVGSPIAGRLQTLAGEQWISVEKLTAADHDSPLYNEKSRAGVFYAESWLLVHMLFLEASYRPHFHDMSMALSTGTAAEAFEKAYGKSMAEVEKDLHNYVRRNSVPALLIDVDLPKSSEDPEIIAAASMQARLMLAALQSDTKDKRDDAKAALEQIEREFPNQWEVERGWAELFMHEGNAAQATKRYARAVELGCNDQRSLLEYGRALGAENRPADSVAVLTKAVASDTTNREAHLELGMAMVRAGMYGASLAEFQAMKTVGPDEAWRFFYHTGFAALRLGDMTEAQRLAEKAQGYAKQPHEQSATAELIRSIAARRTQLERQTTAKAAAPPEAAISQPTSPQKDQPPTLRRKTAPAETTPGVYVPPSKLPTAEGPLKSTDCHGATMVLHLGTGGGERLFLIDDPKKVIITSGDGAPVEFTCGAQKNQMLLVRYQEPPSDSPQYAGVVRGLEFR